MARVLARGMRTRTPQSSEPPAPRGLTFVPQVPRLRRRGHPVPRRRGRAAQAAWHERCTPRQAAPLSPRLSPRAAAASARRARTRGPRRRGPQRGRPRSGPRCTEGATWGSPWSQGSFWRPAPPGGARARSAAEPPLAVRWAFLGRRRAQLEARQPAPVPSPGRPRAQHRAKGRRLPLADCQCSQFGAPWPTPADGPALARTRRAERHTAACPAKRTCCFRARLLDFQCTKRRSALHSNS